MKTQYPLNIQEQEEELAYNLKRVRSLSKIIAIRKKRADAGKERSPYNAKLPAKYRSYMNRANKKGIKFELTVEEFDMICSGHCVFCGTTQRIGIDRRDSSDGYTIDNCQPACGTCNLMKYSHDEEFFIRHVIKIMHNRGLR